MRASPDPTGVGLRRLLAFDEDGVLRLVLAPAGPDAAVRGVVIGDEDPARSYAGRVVLATGPRADEERAVREAARRGAVAVVLREGEGEGDGDGDGHGEPPAAVREAAREGGIALLGRAGWAAWDDVVALVRAALAFDAAGAGDGRGGRAGGDLASLASVVARQCGASITVEDTRFRVLAHSATTADADGLRQSTILGGRVPEWRVAELRDSGLLRALWTSRDVIHRPAAGDGPERLVVAVRSGGEVLGSIWAAADGRRLSPDAADVLRRAAETAVPYLLEHRLRASAGQARRDHAVRSLRDGVGDTRAHLWSLGLAPDGRIAVVVAESAAEGGREGAADRVLEALALQAAAHRATVRVLREEHRLTVLVPVPEDDDGRDAAALARRLAALAAGTADAPAVRVGAGPPAPGAADSYGEALLVVRALREREARGGDDGRPPLRHAGPGDLGHAVDVLRVLDAVGPLWERHGGPLDALLAADRESGGDLARSVGAYLDAAGDVTRAARRLVLHPNTLRYRLRRVRERFGIDLDDPDTRLVAGLAVRLAGSTGPGAGEP
ncbi:helix-turn-helix domain-containing protein [Streptomyces sp. NPDC060194]|uniref:helix-turn-helix domain-containing protein n=1 Tax=Streptomyces sp. NPDC060194 TaxID=3347069 RepID=UPI003658C584